MCLLSLKALSNHRLWFCLTMWFLIVALFCYLSNLFHIRCRTFHYFLQRNLMFLISIYLFPFWKLHFLLILILRMRSICKLMILTWLLQSRLCHHHLILRLHGAHWLRLMEQFLNLRFLIIDDHHSHWLVTTTFRRIIVYVIIFFVFDFLISWVFKTIFSLMVMI